MLIGRQNAEIKRVLNNCCSLIIENELMISFQDSVKQILPKVQSERNFFQNVNGWEIGINGDTGVIYHALYK